MGFNSGLKGLKKGREFFVVSKAELNSRLQHLKDTQTPMWKCETKIRGE
jgi:hypothetical protein